MKDTTSTPKEPDGRAGVTSGRQAGSAEPSNGAAAAPERAPSPAGSDGGPAEPIAAKPDRAAPDRGGADRDGAAAPAGDNGRASVPASSNDPSPSRGTPEAPTAKIRLPQDGNGAVAASEQPTVTGVRPADLAKPGASSGSTGSQAGRSAPSGGAGSSSAKSSAAGPTAPDSTARGSTAARKPTAATTGKAIPGQATPSEPGPPGPSPASGPVPAPGLGAASPPPWNRLPGQAAAAQDSAAATSPPAASGPMSGLIGDGPTAYLLPDSNASAVATDTQPTGRGPLRSGSGRPRPPRQAALQLKRLDPWSMLKLGLVLAVVIFFIWLVAVGVLYGVLDGMGVWDRLNGTYADLVSGEAPTGSPLISAGRVFGLAAVVGAINSLLFAVAVTIGAFVYNVSADLVGGVEVTLSERD